MPNFAVQIPIVGYSIAVIEADTIEAAVAIVHAKDFDLEDDDGEPTVASVQMVGHQYGKAHAPGKVALDMVRSAFEVDN